MGVCKKIPRREGQHFLVAFFDKALKASADVGSVGDAPRPEAKGSGDYAPRGIFRLKLRLKSNFLDYFIKNTLMIALMDQ